MGSFVTLQLQLLKVSAKEFFQDFQIVDKNDLPIDYFNIQQRQKCDVEIIVRKMDGKRFFWPTDFMRIDDDNHFYLVPK